MKKIIHTDKAPAPIGPYNQAIVYNGMLYASGQIAINPATGDLVTDADVTYYTNVIPKRFLYIFPDERVLSNFTQFYNFGNRPNNGIKDLVVRNYDPGNVKRDSSVSTFATYIMSRDNYVLSVVMKGDEQFSIPAPKSKILFSYKCK